MLIRDIKLGEFGYEGVMDFPLFDCEIAVCFDKDVPTEYTERCAEALSDLSETMVEKLCEFSISYCEDLREYFEDENISIPVDVVSKEILQYIKPCSLLVDMPKVDTIGFRMELNCDWEEEHGMEWTINNGEVLYVGDYSDESPWREREYFKNSRCNYAVIEN